ncbi:flagellar motor switch protein FliM [Celeribacter neptunius]|uniref:Flagellar motor switch protein FliM n=1 Tax=Celeribacter neptunius TaxID=588602 RepID=A0A1I3M4P9_9RHOB|nr:flagellar motor switch protein FliM [Celeribacter neptunius]SFI91715.1 flagellar motor switch protein FliM [Celeribacter neptunius]
MSDADIISAMRRKAGVGRPPPDVQPMSPAKALRIAAAKAAEDVLGLVLQVTDVTEEKSAISKLPGQVPEFALLSLLEGPDNGYGLAVLDKNTVASVVEQQTAGKVLNLPPEERAPTATDSVMCTEFSNRVLRLFEMHVAEVQDPPAVSGFHVAAQLREPRSIAIAFDDVPYRLYRVQVSLGRQGRTGEILFVFPYESARPADAQAEDGDFGSSFQDVILKSEARLDTVLHRVNLSLADVTGLQEGMMIPIPREALSRVELRADDHLVSRARLGQINGKRAVCVVLNGEEDEPLDGVAAPFDGMAGLGAIGTMETMGGALGMGQDLPALSDGTDHAGDLPDIGDLPPMGDLPDIGDMPAMGDLPDIGDLPDLGDFPAMGDLPPLE